MSEYQYHPLVDIHDVHIDRNKPKEEKIMDYLSQIRNPYHYKNGKYTIRRRFNEDSPDSVMDCLNRAIKRILEKEE